MKKLLLILIFFITGCIKYNDLGELTIVKSIGIDYDENYYIYAQIIDSIEEDNKPIMKVITINGNTIGEAFNNLHNSMSKEIFLSHIDLLILSHSLSDNNYRDIINYFIKNSYFRNDFYCIFSFNPKALLEKSEYDEIEMFLKNNKRKKKTIKIFNDVIEEYIDYKTITLPSMIYQDEIKYLGDVKYTKKETT